MASNWADSAQILTFGGREMKTRIIGALVLGSLLVALSFLQGLRIADGGGPRPPLPPSSLIADGGGPRPPLPPSSFGVTA